MVLQSVWQASYQLSQLSLQSCIPTPQAGKHGEHTVTSGIQPGGGVGPPGVGVVPTVGVVGPVVGVVGPVVGVVGPVVGVVGPVVGVVGPDVGPGVPIISVPHGSIRYWLLPGSQQNVE